MLNYKTYTPSSIMSENIVYNSPEVIVRRILNLVGYQHHSNGDWYGHDTRLGTDAELVAEGLEILKELGSGFVNKDLLKTDADSIEIVKR